MTVKTQNRTAPVQGSYCVAKEIVQGAENVCLNNSDSSCFEGLTKAKKSREKKTGNASTIPLQLIWLRKMTRIPTGS